MAITPNSSIYFCNVPWASDYKHICDVANMSSVLTGTPLIATVSDYTYIRKDSTINVSLPMDDLIGANYVMYKNSSHENKWFYAFIESMEYKSDLATAVKIRTDVYQTWRNVFSLPACFVAREHANTDTAGDNLIPETLELGDYVQNSSKTYAGLGTMDTIVMSTDVPGENTFTFGTVINNVYTGTALSGFTGSNASSLNTFLKDMTSDQKTDAIVTIYMCPHLFSNFNTFEQRIAGSEFYEDKITVTGPARTTAVDGYTPRNKKLLTYPYNFLYVHNNNGQGNAYPWEFFDGTPQFDVIGSVLPGAQFKLYPANWELGDGVGSDEEYDMALTIGNYPMCAWTYDSYAQWQATQGNLNLMAIGAGAAAVIGGAATGALPVAAGGLMAVFSSLQARKNASVQPETSRGNLNSGSANCSQNKNDFIIYGKSIRKHQAEQIDDFFDMYGYQVNRKKAANLTGRDTWNYVQTINCIVKGGIPETDRVQLQKMFDDGVTIWHTFTNFGDYTQANAIS